MTTYAAELLEYVICNLGIASRNFTERKAKAEAYLDANIGMDGATEYLCQMLACVSLQMTARKTDGPCQI